MIPQELTDGPFLGSDAIRRGLITPDQLRSPAWTRLLRDVYVHLPAAAVVGRICRAQAAWLAAPQGGVISGRSAAWMLGVDVLRRPDEPIEVTIGRDDPMRPRRGVVIRRALVPDSDIDAIERIFHTNLYRTLFDLARRRRPGSERDFVEAVVAFDAITHLSPVTEETFLAYVSAHRGWRGVRLAPETVRHSDRRAESPMESRLRMLLVLAGLPCPHVQHEIRVGDGRCRIDLAYPEELLAIEYDGRAHRDRWQADVRRQTLLADLGWRFLRYTAKDYYEHPDRIIGQVTRALRRQPRRS